MTLQTTAVILSTGRTGTMFFADLLRDFYPQADVYHEAGERSRLINIISHAYLSGFVPWSVPHWAWKRAIAPALETCSKPIYIDSNNQLYAFITIKPELYDNLHVLHLVRDPRDYVRSHINWVRHRLKSFIANCLVPFWQPNAWLLKEVPFRKWIRFSIFKRYCWIWNYKNHRIEQIKDKGFPYLRVLFEDFFQTADPIPALERMIKFLNLEYAENIEERFQRPVNPAKGKSFPHWMNWPSERCRQLHNLCGDTMTRYGYGKEKEWLQKLSSSLG